MYKEKKDRIVRKGNHGGQVRYIACRPIMNTRLVCSILSFIFLSVCWRGVRTAQAEFRAHSCKWTRCFGFSRFDFGGIIRLRGCWFCEEGVDPLEELNEAHNWEHDARQSEH